MLVELSGIVRFRYVLLDSRTKVESLVIDAFLSSQVGVPSSLGIPWYCFTRPLFFACSISST